MSPGDRLGAYARLVRLPAALTVPGDILAGAALGGAGLRPRVVGPIASSLCLYWAGMALNDYVDRELDAEERPERPIPAGEISPRAALGTAVALTTAGLGLAVLGEGRRGLATVVPLTVAVWAYDTLGKEWAVGPLIMGAARGLNVLRGADRLPAALPAALTLALHTASVTTLSRHETAPPSALTIVPAPPSDTSGRRSQAGEQRVRAIAAASLAASVIAGGAAVLTARGGARRHRALTGALAAVFLATYGPEQLAAVRKPTPYHVRRAVAAGIQAMVPLQSVLTAAAGRGGPGLGLLAVYPLARRLSRKVSPT
ncbi:SCO3242 family prenyltransferase [Streptomyces sp. NPDC048718]|uniref:SCO3242 family prenyltransferase n=1 Tax=Streptomyces sp. NPDC048718 TaxID=3365587 RepID=UPI00371B0F90